MFRKGFLEIIKGCNDQAHEFFRQSLPINVGYE